MYYKGGGYMANVKRVGNQFVLTVRNRRKQLVKRRRYPTRVDAMDVMWYYLDDGRPVT